MQSVVRVVVSAFDVMVFWGRIFLVHIRVEVFFKEFEEFHENVCRCSWRASVKHKSTGGNMKMF